MKRRDSREAVEMIVERQSAADEMIVERQTR
jgi:hypothetical protein